MNRSIIVRRTLLAALLAATFAWGAAAQATPGAAVFCEAVSSNGGVCEAWPQGPGFTYFWTTTGSAFLPTPAPPTAAVRQVSCLPFLQQNGRVQVVVVAPDGSRSSASVNVCIPPRGEPGLIFPF